MVQPVFKVPVLVGAYWTLYAELCFYIFISIIWYLKKMERIENIAIACLLLMIILARTYAIWKLPLYTAFLVNVRRLCPL
jgi:peptidoglycan/LPS O-acetylase OafA/YrhL